MVNPTPWEIRNTVVDAEGLRMFTLGRAPLCPLPVSKPKEIRGSCGPMGFPSRIRGGPPVTCQVQSVISEAHGGSRELIFAQMADC